MLEPFLLQTRYSQYSLYLLEMTDYSLRSISHRWESRIGHWTTVAMFILHCSPWRQSWVVPTLCGSCVLWYNLISWLSPVKRHGSSHPACGPYQGNSLTKDMSIVLHTQRPRNSVVGVPQVFISVTSQWPWRMV